MMVSIAASLPEVQVDFIVKSYGGLAWTSLPLSRSRSQTVHRLKNQAYGIASELNRSLIR